MSVLATEAGAIARRQAGGGNVAGGAGVLDRAVGVVKADQTAGLESGGDVAGGGRVPNDAWPERPGADAEIAVLTDQAAGYAVGADRYWAAGAGELDRPGVATDQAAASVESVEARRIAQGDVHR